MKTTSKKNVRKTFIWVGLFIITYILWGVFDAIFKKMNIFEAIIIILPKKIYNMKIPDFVVAIIIIGICIIMIFFNKRFRYLTPNKFKEMMAENERMQRHNQVIIDTTNSLIGSNSSMEDKIKKLENRISGYMLEYEEKLKAIKDTKEDEDKRVLSDQHEFILETIADKESLDIEKKILSALFLEKYRDKTMRDFNIVMNDLCGCSYVLEDSRGYDEPYCIILPEGLKYLKDK